MKLIKIVLLIASLVMIFNCVAGIWEKTPPELLKADFEYIFELDSLSKEEAFSQGKLWIAESYNSAESVITFEDLDKGVVKGTGIGLAQMQGDLFARHFKYNISMYFKENKTKLVFSNIVKHDTFSGGSTLGGMDMRNMAGYTAIKEYFEGLSSNYVAFMKDTTSDDW